MSDRIAVMHDGDIRQIGGPRDIYDHPAERFVADFIGDTNFLSVELLETRGEVAQIRLPSGVETQVRAPDETIAPGPVTLAVRPEHATLLGGEGATLPGTLANVVYFGTDTHFHVDLDGGARFVLRQQNQHGQTQVFNAGDAVTVTLAPGVGQVLRD